MWGTGTCGDREGVGGDMAAVLGIQLVSRLRSFETVMSCFWWMVAGASLMAHERMFKVWITRPPLVNEGWVR